MTPIAQRGTATLHSVAGLLTFLLLVLIAGTLTLWLGQPLTQTLSFVTFGLAFLFATTLTERWGGPRSLFVFLLLMIGLALVSVPMSILNDMSYDGQNYHLPAILALMDGWIPPHEDVRNHDVGHAAHRWLNHYPKRPGSFRPNWACSPKTPKRAKP